MLRKNLGMTQTALAENMNVTHQAVSQWERGDTIPDVMSLPLLAEVLQVPINRLFSKTENNYESESELKKEGQDRGISGNYEKGYKVQLLKDGVLLKEEEVPEMMSKRIVLAIEGNVDSDITCCGSVEVAATVNGDIVTCRDVQVHGDANGDIASQGIVNVSGDANGDVATQATVNIFGNANGDIASGNSVTISGAVQGDVSADTVSVEGNINGDCSVANKLEVSGDIIGDISCATNTTVYIEGNVEGDVERQY
ncbi:polymer-forming cytoskeletal protein [Bacillus niameyensis]|uniref:polymer-forming cytoskeletal protein n=1 Tax=Bacillus niameyensis TaxID=1522308 RepID=UPI001E5C4F84|nr:polymer-forming cytoskeletal protein [Bacillus niameyensis]